MQDFTNMQKSLLHTLKEFNSFCKDNNLTYYAAYGTLIGAIRHNGFIPWDDDLDVFMPRKDYDSLVRLLSAKCENKLQISYYNIGNSVYAFAKVYLPEGTIWEYRQFPFIIGPWIDVFPLDESEKGEISTEYVKLHKLLWKYRKAMADVSLYSIIKQLNHQQILDAIIDTTKFVIYKPFKKLIRSRIVITETKIKSIKGQYFRAYLNGDETFIYNKEWFAKTIEVPFEDTIVSIPIGYDKLLKLQFGNYMEMPPDNERHSKHDCFYIDLDHNKTYDEIIQETHCNRTQKISFSIKMLWKELFHN